MKKLVIAISAIAFASTAAFADPIADRKALMKANGAAAGTISKVVKGETPFDAATVLAALQTLADDAQKMDPAVLWPAGSDVGDTASAPTIWTDPAGFQAAIDKFQADTAAAVAAAPQDVAALQAQLGIIGGNCGACHEAYRIKKN